MARKLSQASKDSMRVKTAATKKAKSLLSKKASPSSKKSADDGPIVFNIPSSFEDATSLIGGPEKAFDFLRSGLVIKDDPEDPNNEKAKLRCLLDDWSRLSRDEKKVINVDKFIEEHDLTPIRLFGMLAENAYALVRERERILRALGDYQMLEASIKHSLKPILGQEERKDHLRRAGHLPTTQKAQIINVNANASAQAQSLAAAQSVQRGLPTFESTMNEDENRYNALDILATEIIAEDIDNRLSEKEPLQLPSGSRFSVEDLESVSEEVEI